MIHHFQETIKRFWNDSKKTAPAQNQRTTAAAEGREALSGGASGRSSPRTPPDAAALLDKRG